MVVRDLECVAKALVSDGKGILAVDEPPETLAKRFSALSIAATPASRRDYREMLFTAPEMARFISGAIVHDEILQQKNSVGTPLTTLLTQHGIMAGFRADTGPKRLAGSFGKAGPQNITSPVGSVAALTAAWGIWKGACVQRPTALGAPALCVVVANRSASRRLSLAIRRRWLAESRFQRRVSRA